MRCQLNLGLNTLGPSDRSASLRYSSRIESSLQYRDVRISLVHLVGYVFNIAVPAIPAIKAFVRLIRRFAGIGSAGYCGRIAGIRWRFAVDHRARQADAHVCRKIAEGFPVLVDKLFFFGR